MTTRRIKRLLEDAFRILVNIVLFPVVLFRQRKKLRKLNRRIGLLEGGRADLEHRLAMLEAENAAHAERHAALARKLAFLEHDQSEQAKRQAMTAAFYEQRIEALVRASSTLPEDCESKGG